MVDPVTVQILRNRIGCLMDEMSHRFFRSGYSTIVRESRDFSCVIVDSAGRLLVAPPMFYHAMSYRHLIQRVIALYGIESLSDGDVFVCNHPYEGALPHTSDMGVVAPIIAQGELIGFAGAIAHKADVGGTMAGSQWVHASETFQEGTLFPPVRLMRGGIPNDEIERIIAANTRQAYLVLGDLRSQVGAVRIGVQRMQELADHHGAALMCAALAAMSEASAREFRAALARLPDGTSTAEGFLDGDGTAENAPVRFHVKVAVSGGHVSFDFTASDDQRRGPVNLHPALVESCCFQALIGLVDPTLRYSDAARDVVEIITRPGSVCDALPPSPCSSYMKSCQRLIDIVIEALNPFCPARGAAGAGGSGGSIVITWGSGPRAVPGFQYEIFGSAYGGTNGQDGASGVTVHLTNVYITPIEILETEFPCRVTRFELIAGSGGDGTYRGGLSFRREYEMLQPGNVMFRGDRTKFPAKSYAGGKDGRTARFVLYPGEAREKVLPPTCQVQLVRGDRFVIEAAGGGGYGDPALRSNAARARDREDGYVVELN